jgi:hypothetical protein
VSVWCSDGLSDGGLYRGAEGGEVEADHRLGLDLDDDLRWRVEELLQRTGEGVLWVLFGAGERGVEPLRHMLPVGFAGAVDGCGAFEGGAVSVFVDDDRALGPCGQRRDSLRRAVQVNQK